MTRPIREGFMVFLVDGANHIGSVRKVSRDHIVIYVENSGEFVLPMTTVADVHSQKVVLSPRLVDKALLKAIGHVHDREDPSVAG